MITSLDDLDDLDLDIERADGSDAETLAAGPVQFTESFLAVVREWQVIGEGFTGFINLDRVEDVGGDVSHIVGVGPEEFGSLGSNGAGDPIGVAPEGATLNPPGSILHFNHDTAEPLGIVKVAPDLESFVIGLANYADSWPELADDATEEDEDAADEATAQELQRRLEQLGWPDEIRRFWPGRNDSGLFD